METKRGSRRSFLRMSALLGMGTAASALLTAENATAFLFGTKEHRVSKTRLVMGTYVSITTIHSSKDEAHEAISLAFDEIDRLNGLLSRHLSSTPLAELNSKGELNNCPAELLDLVERSKYYHHETGGAFDITVLPLLQLYEQTFSAGKKPAEEQIKSALSRVGMKGISIEGRDIFLAHEGMGLTLDGIAKGYIVDRASAVLLSRGIENHLINGGGDIRTHGSAAKGKAWSVAVQDPGKGGEYPEIIRMNSGAVATSGNYEIYYDDEKLFHHIVNPQTGRSPILSKSVTVSASSVMAADALSTGVFVMEPREGLHYIDDHPELECFIIDKDNIGHRSRGWATLQSGR